MPKFEPCKNCSKRTIGCHSNCEDYKKFIENKAKKSQELHTLDIARVKGHNALSKLRPRR